MKKVLIILGAILLAALIAGGSFYAGIAYQTNQADQVRARFMQDRGMTEGELPQPGQFHGGNMPQGGQPHSGVDFTGRGTTGVVKTIDGNVTRSALPRMSPRSTSPKIPRSRNTQRQPSPISSPACG